jgi:membrane protein
VKKHTQYKNILKHYYIFLRDFFSDLFDDKIGHYAASLSWSTLFSIIPLLVILLWVFTTLPIFASVHEKIEALIFSNLLPTQSEEVMNHIKTFMQNSHKLGYIGISYVIFAAILFFKNYDYIVNDIFSVPKRTILGAMKTYLFLLIIIPAMMALSFYFSTLIQEYLDSHRVTSGIHLFYFLPYLVIWMVFYVLYQFSANTRITVSSAMTSSFITSLVWYLSKSVFVFYALHYKTYASIYGSISILLFLFLWIYISWAIFLHGLKFCDLLNKGKEIDHI